MKDDLQLFDELPRHARQLRDALHGVIIGQNDILDRLILSVLCQGHVLIVGVPGLAKTTLVRTLADCIGWSFSRIQFTPDMLPSDVVGTEIIQEDTQTNSRQLVFSRGPVFANLVLADEINRTPPRTQAALLEAMAERQVTAAGNTLPLDDPFVVVATQNPIEQEGTYRLPEAQLDRFMFSLTMTYPTADEERQIVENRLPDDWKRNRGNADSASMAAAATILNRDDTVRACDLIRRMPVSSYVANFAVKLARASRPDDPSATENVKRYVSWGAGPRAGQYLALAARSLAATEGEPTPNCDHIKRVAPAVLEHRIVPNYAAIGEGIDAATIVQSILNDVSAD